VTEEQVNDGDAPATGRAPGSGTNADRGAARRTCSVPVQQPRSAQVPYGLHTLQPVQTVSKLRTRRFRGGVGVSSSRRISRSAAAAAIAVGTGTPPVAHSVGGGPASGAGDRTDLAYQLVQRIG
jgi:hypothetical protein